MTGRKDGRQRARCRDVRQTIPSGFNSHRWSMTTKIIIGSHRPTWLAYEGRPEIMVSRNTMPRSRLPRAVSSWVLDSGGFTELSMHGEWRMGAGEYVDLVKRYSDEIGHLHWAAPQDWMCEPFMLAKTGLDVAEHQRRTTRNYLSLRTLDGALPIIPVLQGWTRDDYLRHVDRYDSYGVDLTACTIVGVGSVCRRQHTDEAVDIFRSLHALGLRLHGFGLKAQGIAKAWPYLESCDSMAWSYNARKVASREGSCDPTRSGGRRRFRVNWGSSHDRDRRHHLSRRRLRGWPVHGQAVMTLCLTCGYWEATIDDQCEACAGPDDEAFICPVCHGTQTIQPDRASPPEPCPRCVDEDGP